MAIYVFTAKPSTLLASITKAIDDEEIDTWEYDKDGDFTHSAASGQWANKAWLRPAVQSGALVFGLLGQEGVKMTKPVYGVYHGRFIEMLLTHFDGQFSHVMATAQASAEDSFK